MYSVSLSKIIIIACLSLLAAFQVYGYLGVLNGVNELFGMSQVGVFILSVANILWFLLYFTRVEVLNIKYDKIISVAMLVVLVANWSVFLRYM